MFKIIKKIINIFICTLVLFIFLTKPDIIINSVKTSLEIFYNNILPTLLPFFILIDFLTNVGYINYLKKLFKFKHFHILILSMISGLPSNAKYINNALNNNEISLYDAEIMLGCSSFPNPMFIISSVGFLMLNDITLGVIILISVYLSNIIVYLIHYRLLDNSYSKDTLDKKEFPIFLKDSIINNTTTLIVILGTMIFFITVLNIICNLIPVSDLIKSIISGILEISSGAKNISLLNINFKFKFILLCLTLSWNGLSVFMQSLSIVSKHNISIKHLLIIKIEVLLTSIIINYFYIIFWVI